MRKPTLATSSPGEYDRVIYKELGVQQRLRLLGDRPGVWRSRLAL